MVSSMNVIDLSVLVGDWPTFHISKLICNGQMRVNERGNTDSR